MSVYIYIVCTRSMLVASQSLRCPIKSGKSRNNSHCPALYQSLPSVRWAWSLRETLAQGGYERGSLSFTFTVATRCFLHWHSDSVRSKTASRLSLSYLSQLQRKTNRKKREKTHTRIHLYVCASRLAARAEAYTERTKV